jgi:hypothetical protein
MVSAFHLGSYGQSNYIRKSSSARSSLERRKWAIHSQPSASSYSWCWPLVVHRVRPRIARNYFEHFGQVIPLLPRPEHLVDEAVVEVKDRVETRGVVLSHVAVGACNGVKVSLIGDLVASNRQIDVVVRTLEGHNGFGGYIRRARLGPCLNVEVIFILLSCRGRVGKDHVIRCFETLGELLACSGVYDLTIMVLNGKS